MGRSKIPESRRDWHFFFVYLYIFTPKSERQYAVWTYLVHLCVYVCTRICVVCVSWLLQLFYFFFFVQSLSCVMFHLFIFFNGFLLLLWLLLLFYVFCSCLLFVCICLLPRVLPAPFVHTYVIPLDPAESYVRSNCSWTIVRQLVERSMTLGGSRSIIEPFNFSNHRTTPKFPISRGVYE